MDNLLEGIGALACIGVMLWAFGSFIFINTSYNLDVSQWGCIKVMDGKCSTYERKAKN